MVDFQVLRRSREMGNSFRSHLYLGAFQFISSIAAIVEATDPATGAAEAIPLLPKNSRMVVFEPNAGDYQTYQIIGHSSDDNGIVVLASHISSGITVAIKKYNMDQCHEMITQIQEEVLLNRQLMNPSILSFSTSFLVGQELWIVMPLMAYASAKDLINAQFTEGLPELVIAFILRDILHALDYLHKKGYIHRSVRASHILIAESGKAYLTGLKYACSMVEDLKWKHFLHQFPHDTPKNINWLSPELLEQNLQGYNEKSDIYSLGVTACELANGVVPFAEMPATFLLIEKLNGSTPHLLDSSSLLANLEDAGTTPVHHTDSGVGDSVASTANMQNKELAAAQHRHFSDNFHNFVELCLQRDPYMRPTAAALLTHSFFKQCRKSGLTLPELLFPVIPISSRNPPSDDDVVDVEGVMADLDLNEDWNF